MSIAAYPLQSAIPSYADFELLGGQNSGSCFVLRGQSSGAPTILRPRVTPIQEASMSVSIKATLNTLYNNANVSGTATGWEGIAPTIELLKITSSGLKSIWHNGLFGQARPDLWRDEKRDWHTLTWIQEIPQLGADLLNIGLVNKCPSGYAKLGNLSLMNHYARHYQTVVTGESDSITLVRKSETRPAYRVAGWLVQPVAQYWYESHLDTLLVSIKAGESVTQNVVGILGGLSDSESDIPIELGITIAYRGRDGLYIYKEAMVIKSEQPVIENQTFIGSVTWVADQDYTMAEPIVYLKTKFGRAHVTVISHRGINIDITATQSLLTSPGL